MKILYFSWVRDKIGVGQEDRTPPQSVTTVEELINWLKDQGEGYQKAFDDTSVIRAAVNQEHVPFSYTVAASDEVAFFPPVTGG